MPMKQSTSSHIRKSKDEFAGLYESAVASTRVGAVFNAHSYPTKINAAAIVPFILKHTKPGDVVFDGFSGSGATGIAAALCGSPDDELRQQVEGFIGTA